MSNSLSGLKPELVWKYFAEISKIPRGSKNEKKYQHTLSIQRRSWD